MKLKKIAGLALGASLAMGMALPAMAANNLTFLTLDSAANATVEAGDNVSAKVTYDITGDTPDVESMSWEVVGSGLPETCINIADRLNSGTFTSTFDINTAGATEGTWDVKIRIYGVDGSGTDNNCGGTINDSMTFTNRLTITENSNDTGGVINNTGTDNGTGSSQKSQFDKLMTAFAALMLKLGGAGTPAPAPTTTPVCVAYAQAYNGTQMNVYNDANVRLQGFLLSQGASIPALKAGASFGFYGPQTMAAVAWFQSLNHFK